MATELVGASGFLWDLALFSYLGRVPACIKPDFFYFMFFFLYYYIFFSEVRPLAVLAGCRYKHFGAALTLTLTSCLLFPAIPWCRSLEVHLGGGKKTYFMQSGASDLRLRLQPVPCLDSALS